MILWIDAQLSPALARWINETFGVAASAVRDLGLREAKDLVIFHAAREAGAVVMSKDSDFVLLLERFGPPPQVLWVTCGTTSKTTKARRAAGRWPSHTTRISAME